MRKKTEQMFYSKNDAIGQHLEARFRAIESPVKALETHIETAYRIADRATRDIERHTQRLTALESKPNHEQKEMFAIIKDFMDEHPECFASFAPKPDDALRAACEGVRYWNTERMREGGITDSAITILCNDIEAIKSALSAKVEPIEDAVGVDDLVLDVYHMKRFFLIDERNEDESGNGGGVVGAEILNVRNEETTDGVACGLSAKDIENIHRWTGEWLAQFEKAGA